MLSRCRRVPTLTRSISRSPTVCLSASRTTTGKRSLLNSRRWMSTESESTTDGNLQSESSSSHAESIFSSSASWDDIFQDRTSSPSLSQSAVVGPDEFKPIRRQSVTERESKIITDMLDMIFNKRRPEGDTKLPDTNAAAGVGGGRIDDLVGRLRRHTRVLRWAKEPTADLLDQKKEQMLHCNSDLELLEWAQREVFAESERYEEAAKKAIEQAAAAPGLVKELPRLQSPVYPQVIAHLMRTFRDHYKDPNLALFIFHHAQKLSVVSYVFGCSTEAYNELIQTRWECFRDLEGVYNAVDEMTLNGVPFDVTTRKTIETVRRDIGTVELHREAGDNAQQATWSLLSRTEQLVASQQQPQKASPLKMWDRWKSDILKDGGGTTDDDWAFDSWMPEDPETDRRNRKKIAILNTRRALTRKTS